MNEKWDLRFLDLAKTISLWSKDPSTKIGAVITQNKKIVSVGYNGLPSFVPDDPVILNNRELKYEHVIHGEVNAILQAPKDALFGSTLYVYPFLPCSRCASMIIESNIIRVVSFKNNVPRWEESIQRSKKFFELADVQVEEYLN